MGYNFLQHFVFSLKLEQKLVLDDFALLPPENSQRIGKIYPWRTRLLYDPELLYCAKRVNRFYDEDTGKLLRIHMVICMPDFESIVYIYILSKPFPHKAWNKRRIDAVSNIQRQLTTIHFRWGQNGVNNWALGVFF